MSLCPVHCPKEVLAPAAVSVAVVAVGMVVSAEWVMANLVLIVACTLVVTLPAVVVSALFTRRLERHTLVEGQFRQQSRYDALVAAAAEERLALPARAPLAIEAPKAVLRGYVLEDEYQETRPT